MTTERDHHRPLVQRLGASLTHLTEKWVPNSLIIVWMLTGITFALAIWLGAPVPNGAKELVCKSPQDWGWGIGCTAKAWGRGFWGLLTLSMQLCLMLITGYAVARAPVMKRVLQYLASLPKKPVHAVLLLSVFSMVTACIHWGVSLMASGMLAVFIVGRANPLQVDYKLLIASAYLGLGCTWHAGLTGTAPLLANTPNNPTLKIVGGLIPQSQTIFTAFNIVLVLIVIVAITLLMCWLHPSQSRTQTIARDQLNTLAALQLPSKPSGHSPSDRLMWWPGFNIMVVGIGLLWLYYQVRDANASAGQTPLFTFDNFNFFFLMLSIALNYRPALFVNAVEEGARAVWGIIIQFPFYAGIYGLFIYTDLGTTLGRWVAGHSSAQTFPLLTFWYTGVLNYFIPSGGAEWMVTSPYLVPSAQQLGVSMGQMILAYSWGNMMTDMIQPFYAIPLLSVTKLEFRDIVGYLLLVFLLYFIITTAAFWLLPRL